jgi:hypothetical protein
MKINYSFFVLLIFSLYIGYYDKLLLFLLSLLIHECGHLIFIKLFRVKIYSFSLSAFGGVLEINNVDLLKL